MYVCISGIYSFTGTNCFALVCSLKHHQTGDTYIMVVQFIPWTSMSSVRISLLQFAKLVE